MSLEVLWCIVSADHYQGGGDFSNNSIMGFAVYSDASSGYCSGPRTLSTRVEEKIDQILHMILTNGPSDQSLYVKTLSQA